MAKRYADMTDQERARYGVEIINALRSLVQGAGPNLGVMVFLVEIHPDKPPMAQRVSNLHSVSNMDDATVASFLFHLPRMIKEAK